MMNDDILLQGLSVDFHTAGTVIHAVKNVSLKLEAGCITGLIGETGSGKSVIASAILRLLPDYAELRGSILYNGRDILALSARDMRALRRSEIGLIPQSPAESLNPSRRILKQTAECFSGSATEKKSSVLEKLRSLGFSDPQKVGRSYPYQLSGGMKQRALSLFGMREGLHWIIADEPTKGLDTVIYQQVYEILRSLSGNGRSMLIITHDLILAEKLCDRVVVLYEGAPVEYGTAQDIFSRPLHPYTRGLLAALPENGLVSMPPKTITRAEGCPFCERCAQATEKCFRALPEERMPENGHMVRCYLYDKC